MSEGFKDTRGRGLAKHARQMDRTLSRYAVAVGVLDPKPVEGSNLNTAQLMTIHEFGAPSRNIPQRSILRSTLQQERGIVGELASEGLREMKAGGGVGKTTPRRVLVAVGRYLQTKMRARFGSNALAPLAPSTLAATPDRKGGPLLNTGALRKAIAYKIVRRTQDGGVER